MYAVVVDNHNREVQRINFPNKSWLLESLEQFDCQIFFRKTSNGQFRTLFCTRNLTKLPRRFKQKYTEIIENPHGYGNIIPVWDINDRTWKSFYFENVIKITVNIGDTNGK